MTQYDRRAGYVAIGPTARTLGRFRSLDEAKAAIERRRETLEGRVD